MLILLYSDKNVITGSRCVIGYFIILIDADADVSACS